MRRRTEQQKWEAATPTWVAAWWSVVGPSELAQPSLTWGMAARCVVFKTQRPCEWRSGSSIHPKPVAVA